mgnify:CR=1 FL=1
MGLLKWRVCKSFFTYYISQQTFLADVTVGCQSNDHRVSSISDILAPAAKSSASGTACSRLPWPAVLPHRPHLPYYSYRWPGHLSPNPHPSTTMGSPPLGHSLPRSHHRPSHWCSRHGVVNVVNKQQHRKRDVHGEADNWDPHGPWPHASKYLLTTPKRMNTPADSSDPTTIS